MSALSLGSEQEKLTFSEREEGMDGEVVVALVFGVTGTITGVWGLVNASTANRRAKEANEIAEGVRDESKRLMASDVFVTRIMLSMRFSLEGEAVHLRVVVLENKGETRAHDVSVRFIDPTNAERFPFEHRHGLSSVLAKGNEVAFAIAPAGKKPAPDQRIEIIWTDPLLGELRRVEDPAGLF